MLDVLRYSLPLLKSYPNDSASKVITVINGTEHADFKSYYDRQLKKKVNHYFAEDFSMFCYPLLELGAD